VAEVGGSNCSFDLPDREFLQAGLSVCPAMASFYNLLALLAVVSVVANSVDKTVDPHRQANWASFLHTEALSFKANPITKVVNQLETMQGELKDEAEKDQAAYEKMQCWCEGGEEAKKKSIADCQTKIDALPPVIEANNAKAMQVTNDLEALRKALVDNESGLKEAQALRYKEAEDFMQEERDNEDTIRGCKMALNVLSTNHDSAFPQEAVTQVKQVLRKHRVLEPAMLEKLKTQPGHKLVTALTQKNPHLQEYAPQSGELVGMLKTMLEEFEENLATMQAEEANAAAAFKELKPAKEAEMRAQNKQVREKLAQKVKADKAAQDAKLDMEETKNVQAVDQQALLDIRERCPVMDKEFETRTMFRQQEGMAIGEAIKILTDDDARDAMHHSTTLLQVRAQKSELKLSKPAIKSAITNKLLQIAKRHALPQMALLALAVKSDVFAKVKESIDTMVDQLNTQEKDEFKQRDYCNDELHQNTLQKDELYHDKENQMAKIAELEARVEQLANEIKVAKAEIADTQIQMMQAYEARKEENAEFMVINADNQLTQATLNKALNKLNEFYTGSNEVPKMLLQTRASSSVLKLGQPANYEARGSAGEGPDGFKKLEKGSGGGKVMTMLQDIIKESAQEMTETISDEHASQMAHEEYGRQQNKVIGARMKEISTKSEEQAQAENDLVETKGDLAQTGKDLQELYDYANGVHRECDFLLDNFQARRDARVEEIEALNEAKAMMSGMA